MNKYTLYLPLFFALFALAGCEKEHTGYLFTENARYPIDSLKIIRYEDYNQEVIRLEEQLNSYSGEILDSLNAYRTIEAEEEKIIEELDRLEGIMNKHGEKLNAYLDQFEYESDAHPDRVQELTDNCEKAYEAWVTYELEVYQPVYQIRDRIDRFQTISHDLCRLFSLDTAGIVEDQGAPCGAILSFRRGIGVKSQVQVKISGIRGGNGRGGGHIRGIADIPDT